VRTPSSRAKSEPLSPDKGDFPSLNAFSERVKGSLRSAQEIEQKQKPWGIFLLPLTWGRLWSDSSAEERQKNHVRLKIASPCVPSTPLLSFASHIPILSPARKPFFLQKPEPSPGLGER
jgi:hypothetical protein